MIAFSSFVIVTIVFRLNLGLNKLFSYTFLCVHVTVGDKLKWLFNVAKIVNLL